MLWAPLYSGIIDPGPGRGSLWLQEVYHSVWHREAAIREYFRQHITFKGIYFILSMPSLCTQSVRVMFKIILQRYCKNYLDILLSGLIFAPDPSYGWVIPVNYIIISILLLDNKLDTANKWNIATTMEKEYLSLKQLSLIVFSILKLVCRYFHLCRYSRV